MAHLDTRFCDREADTFSYAGVAGIVGRWADCILDLFSRRDQVAGIWGNNNGTVAHKWHHLPMRYFLQNIY